MIIALISVGTIGIVLFILSFFMNDQLKDIEYQVEQIRISSLQDRYLINNKLKVLEEELLSEPLDVKDYQKDQSTSHWNR
ncbi:hypothetical protein ACFFJI_01400 [Allobacillus sp. GCM10007491]|uniref:Uncharacterized protein n=1 Tax=Allobacillus saliphilus TaxID=2912308 RepID=A0A941CXS5_9BACI|nr:hypothetical protein [Allobacillus saliphilus]MBR7554373.1 hypothetical protein [Allobacillus saliphilus]